MYQYLPVLVILMTVVIVVTLGLLEEVVNGPGELEFNIRGHRGHNLQIAFVVDVGAAAIAGSARWGT